MSYKYNKATCDRVTKINLMNTKRASRVTPKRVIISKKLGNCSEKSCSTGIITEENSSRPKKITKSDGSFSTKHTGISIDYCSKCGDGTVEPLPLPTRRSTVSNSDSNRNGSTNKSMRRNTVSTSGSNNGNSTKHKDDIEITYKSKANGEKNGKMKIKENGKSTVKQYYKNENFQSTESIHETENDFRKMSLDTIKELPETHVTSDNVKTLADECNIFEIYSDSEEMGFLDVNDDENLDNLKKFRNENYFECHSVKSRVESKENVSAISLTNHKCVYRFYLNDRLFPIPLSTDHHDNVRCVECHLPMDLNLDLQKSDKANGTIQAKVKLNTEKEAQDMILFLPVEDRLIIKEKRKQIKEENEVMYFGVIKLDSFGNSIFKSTMPTDSLALKYQKGYKEHTDSDTYKYSGVEKGDVIII